MITNRSIAVTVCAILLAGCPGIARDGKVVTHFKKLTKSTKWHRVDSIKMNFRTYHPQGMVIVRDTIYVSAVHVTMPALRYGTNINGNDRSAGKGVGYLFKVDMQGNLLKRITLGEGNMYHPGGIDFDGKDIWVPVSEYRPHSASIIYRVDPASMTGTKVLRFADHIGAIVHDTKDHTLHGVNWGSRTFYTWKLDEQPEPADPDLARIPGVANGSHYIDYQDCHYLADNCMLCGGLNKYEIPDLGKFALGGLELVDLQTRTAVHQVPVPLWVKPTLAMTNNPFYSELKDDHLRFYFLPEDDESTIYVYDAH